MLEFWASVVYIATIIIGLISFFILCTFVTSLYIVLVDKTDFNYDNAKGFLKERFWIYLFMIGILLIFVRSSMLPTLLKTADLANKCNQWQQTLSPEFKNQPAYLNIENNSCYFKDKEGKEINPHKLSGLGK